MVILPCKELSFYNNTQTKKKTKKNYTKHSCKLQYLSLNK